MIDKMADEDAEVRTRVQREAAIKDLNAVFDKHARSLNKVAREVQFHFTSVPIDVKAVQGLAEEYKSIVDTIANVFERIVDLSEGLPPQEVKADFKRIDTESSVFMRDVSDRVCKFHDQERLDRSQNQDRDVFETQTRFKADEQSESISKLCSQLVLNRLPTAEPEVFSGDPLQFNDWMNSFEALVSSRSVPDSEGVYYLKKYLSGEAKACVQGLLSLSTSQAFHNALKTLKERFGDDFVIANAFKQKLRKWPKIQNHDYKGLRDFSDYLNNVHIHGFVSVILLVFGTPVNIGLHKGMLYVKQHGPLSKGIASRSTGVGSSYKTSTSIVLDLRIIKKTTKTSVLHGQIKSN